jgi:hypothetical protein
MPEIRFHCPECQKTLKLSDPTLAGKKIRCPNCKGIATVPAPAPEPAPVDLPLELVSEKPPVRGEPPAIQVKDSTAEPRPAAPVQPPETVAKKPREKKEDATEEAGEESGRLGSVLGGFGKKLLKQQLKKSLSGEEDEDEEDEDIEWEEAEDESDEDEDDEDKDRKKKKSRSPKKPDRSEKDSRDAKKTSALGVISLVLGLLGLPLSLIPCVNFVGLPLVALGLLLGVIGFIVARRGRTTGAGLPIAGTLVCLLGVLSSAGWIAAIAWFARDAQARRAQEEKEIREGPAIRVTAETLAAQYQEEDADSQYKGKVLELSGPVARVSAAESDDPTVELKAAAGETISCTFKEAHRREVAALPPGRHVTIRGRCSGKRLWGVSLENCILTESSPEKPSGDKDKGERKPADKSPPDGPAPVKGKLTALDLAPGGVFLTMNAPPGAVVKPEVGQAVIRGREKFRLNIRADDEGAKILLDLARKAVGEAGVDVVEDKGDVLIFGTRAAGQESYQCYVKVTVGGQRYLCYSFPDPLDPDVTKAQVVLMAECAKSLTRTEANKQAEARMRQAIARLEELDSCRFSATTNAVEIGGEDATDADLALVKDVPQTQYLSISAARITPAGLGPLRELRNLTSVALNGKMVTDAWLTPLKSLPLRKLTLTGTSITLAGWKSVKELPDLEELKIQQQPIDGAVLQVLASTPQLTGLVLYDTRTGDDALKHLSSFKKLQSLTLNENPVTDTGLKQLAGLTKLVIIDVKDTKVTKAGVEDLKKALPRCDVYSNAK